MKLDVEYFIKISLGRQRLFKTNCITSLNSETDPLLQESGRTRIACAVAATKRLPRSVTRSDSSEPNNNRNKLRQFHFVKGKTQLMPFMK